MSDEKLQTNMDHPDLVQPGTPAIAYENVSYWKTEDSGYHTSFTPGSIECAEVSNENLDPSILQTHIHVTGQIQVGYNYTPDLNFRPSRNFRSRISAASSFGESPIVKRGVKRPYPNENDTQSNLGNVSTPTSVIAGGIQKLKVSDGSKLYLNSSIDTISSGQYHLERSEYTLSYPSTPVKRICKTSCKLSSSSFNDSLNNCSPLRTVNNICLPPRKSINFTIHSLSCETQGLQEKKHRAHSKVARVIEFKPEQKVDIVGMLYHKIRCMPAISKILCYLSSEDIFNFSLVSPTWMQICEDISGAKSRKDKYLKYLVKAKENRDNIHRGPKINDGAEARSLKQIQNVLESNTTKTTQRSPPGTPRTIKFKRFVKSASLDSRAQLSCVRCQQPSKVTEEASGEEWAECTSSSCSYQFCRNCKFERHPGKSCFQYDLDGPSPSKRKKTACAVGTKKSRKNLRRLL